MNDILFLSTRGQGMNPDMDVLKNHLVSVPNVSLYYFMKTEAVSQNDEKEAVLQHKQKALGHCRSVICVDASLKGVSLERERQVRLLITGLYDSVFREALAENQKKKKTFNGFTHIFAISPFAEEMFQEMYTNKEISLIKGIPSPAMWDICRDRSRDQMKNLFYRHCPAANGKKVLLFYSPYKDPKNESAFAVFDLKRLLDRIDEGWIVCTNIKEIQLSAGRLAGAYQRKICYIPNNMWIIPAIYSADFLVTDNSYFSSVFAARKQPVYVFPYMDNYFEQYMKKFFPDQFLTDINNLADVWDERNSFAEKHKMFFERFTYDSDIEPIPKICSLMQVSK